MIKEFIASKMFRNILIVLVALVVLLLDFRLGEMVGFRKASFSYGWAASYHRNFAGPPEGFMPMMRGGAPRGGEFMPAHGAFATVLEASSTSIVARGADGVERTFAIEGDTTIRCNNAQLTASDIKPGDRIVVIGDPDEAGTIEAKFIRIFR